VGPGRPTFGAQKQRAEGGAAALGRCGDQGGGSARIDQKSNGLGGGSSKLGNTFVKSKRLPS